ncbi:MAG TPA: hypothetical protein VNH11_16385 [Pirellulales bacterium]|nr:hypothetical protein [Pirellulales bacterium]
MVRANRQLITEYQRLLTANESLASVKRAIKLVWHVLGARVRPTANGFVCELFNAECAEVDEQLRQAIERLGPLGVPADRKVGGRAHSRSSEQQKLRAVVRETEVALTLAPTVASMPEKGLGETSLSLLMDSCMLLAHHAYFALLPKLDEVLLASERDAFLSGFRQFAESQTRACDRFALLALYFDAVDAPQDASDARRAALAATPADAHEFMTELQSSWSSLIERAMPGEALELLLDNYPRVPRRDLDEVNELIRQTFRHQKAASNGHSGPRESRAKRRSH